MTANVQDYLKLIYQEGGFYHQVPNKIIAEKLGIAPPSVTEMLVKLDKQGYLDYTPYKGSILTDKGLASCIPIVRGHRLWEVFLIRHLGYSWSEAHEDAHLLEHTTPLRMLERLDYFLNYPEYCPHGSAIPKADGSYPMLQLVPMAELAEGEAGIIRQVSEETELLDYLEQTGLQIGSCFKIIKVEAYEGPYYLDVKGDQIQISFKAAGKVFVERERT